MRLYFGKEFPDQGFDELHTFKYAFSISDNKNNNKDLNIGDYNCSTVRLSRMTQYVFLGADKRIYCMFASSA